MIAFLFVLIYIILCALYSFYVVKQGGGFDYNKTNTLKKKINFFIQAFILFPLFLPIGLVLEVLNFVYGLWDNITDFIDDWSELNN